MKIEQVMTAPVITCRVHDSLADAARAMWEHDIGCLPVVDDSERVVGIITDRDICMAAYTQGAPLHAIRMPVAMSTRVLSCRASDPLASGERAMAQGQVRRLPVLDDDGRPLGIVSLNDLARASQRMDVSTKEVATTLAAVCAPRNAVAPAA
jgi:CBS domain-containing protein